MVRHELTDMVEERGNVGVGVDEGDVDGGVGTAEAVGN